MAADLAFRYFARQVREHLGIDLSGYRRDQVDRRLHALLGRHPGESLFTLGRRLAFEPALAAEVASALTVNVSEFFRNPDRFQELERAILPKLAQTGRLRIWSAGCSVGAEPYSLAISALECHLESVSIWATDVDEDALARARQGVYRPGEVQAVDPARLRRYFSPAGDGWAVRPEVRRLVRFQRHDLLQDAFPLDWDLIACRNVVIYFTEAARVDLWRRLAAALRPGGVLFVGATESILGAADLGLRPLAPFFYERVA